MASSTAAMMISGSTPFSRLNWSIVCANRLMGMARASELHHQIHRFNLVVGNSNHLLGQPEAHLSLGQPLQLRFEAPLVRVRQRAFQPHLHPAAPEALVVGWLVELAVEPRGSHLEGVALVH